MAFIPASGSACDGAVVVLISMLAVVDGFAFGTRTDDRKVMRHPIFKGNQCHISSVRRRGVGVKASSSRGRGSR